MKIGFTVAICTLNGARRLPHVLDQLKSQQVNQAIEWEILVVDNNSTDNTAEVVQHYQARWNSTCSLRYCFEPQQGLTFARHRAISEANGEYVGFLDDDNLATSDWVAQSYKFGQTHPQAGAFGSRICGEFEAKPPANFHRIASLLALTERGSQAHCYEPSGKVLPPGAGLVVRKQAWLDHVPAPEEFVLQGRTDSFMLAGEDFEAILHMQRVGWEIWYNPAMLIYHLIPGSRLQKDYLIPLCRGIGLSRYQTRMLSVSEWQRPLALGAYLLNDLRKILLHLLKYKTAVRQDLVAACEMELYVSSLVSPFFIWSRQLRK